MAELQLSFERNGTALRIIGDIVKGWQSAKDGFGFFGLNQIDFSGGGLVRVILQVRARPNRFAFLAKEFPDNLSTRTGNESLNAKVEGARLEVFVDLEEHVDVLEGANKLGVKWLDVPVGKAGPVTFYLMLVVSFTFRNPSRARVTWEHDLLPFLPGGQFESNRRQH